MGILRRWYRWKYSGIITVPVVLILITGGIVYSTQSLDFFHTWNCNTIMRYQTDENLPSDIIPYSELTDQQLESYEKIVKECKRIEMFNP